jgi:hypothetical protein
VIIGWLSPLNQEATTITAGKINPSAFIVRGKGFLSANGFIMIVAFIVKVLK